MVPEGGKTFSKTNFRNILKVIHMTEGAWDIHNIKDST